ncbi:unnamed protein product [Rotaria socialis]|uniref:Uncharacterized protein n=2 Tax=Rotaria socialis TaxID=392032 RepID=A0A818HTQ1_9BILA|nr:unnamed protein product [Rotaria socialis]
MDTDYNQGLKTINENKSSDQPVEETKRRRKCHGNRKQPEPKKVQKKQNLILTLTSIPDPNKVYRVAAYLKRPPRLLIQALGRQLNHLIKTKSEHAFIYSRLKLLDLQFCSNVHQSLCQSYYDIGYEQHQWPDHLYKISEINEPQLCRKFVQDYLTHIQQQLEQCITKLNLQAETCPKTLTVTLIDHHLKEYICSQQKRFTRKIQYQLKRFKDEMHEKRLHHILFQNNLTSHQKEAINRIIHLRETELKIRKELLLLEQRILSKLLPATFDQLDTLVAYDFYTPALEHQYSLSYKIKRSKILRETKRTWLNILMESYDVKMKEYGNYIRPNRTALRSYKERKKKVQEQHNIMVNRTKLELPEKSCRDAGSNIFKQFSERLQACLMLHYMIPVPFIEHVRAQRETDKGGNLYVSHVNEFEEKAVEYRMTTGVYEELSSSSIEEILGKVTRLLNDLHAKTNQLSSPQYKKLLA